MNLPSNIVLTHDIAFDLGAFFRDHHYSNVCVIVDENTRQHCYSKISKNIPSHHIIEIKSGEEEKNLNTCHIIWHGLTTNEFDRRSLIINLGGGVIGDMGGFCAATYKRGVDFINIPTTLLAQVDASIGGKLGIDFQNFKNHIGIFQNPLRVFIDSSFFETLPTAELRSGYAEVIKHCLIRDAGMFSKITNIPYDQLDMFDLTRHSIDIKNKVVQEDPTEKGLRKILNFGHTIGHAIESHFLNQPDKKLLHGEAIAIGMICEAYLSERKLGMTETELDKITGYIMEVYGCKAIDTNDIEAIIKLTKQDKKNEGGTIKCSLLNRIGDCTFNIDIDHDDIRSSIEYFNSRI